jgi:hypothetical protein
MQRPACRVAAALLLSVSWITCSRSATPEETVFRDAVSDRSAVVPQAPVEFDALTSSDGTGSLRIRTGDSTTVRLYEIGDVDAEDARLVYRARLRTEGVQGQVYLEMWCRFPGQGEFFSRALHAPLTGSTDWTLQETPFFLERGQNPDHIALNLIITGAGTVWVDDVVLLKAPR